MVKDILLPFGFHSIVFPSPSSKRILCDMENCWAAASSIGAPSGGADVGCHYNKERNSIIATLYFHTKMAYPLYRMIRNARILDK
jgi:hypothetical protein